MNPQEALKFMKCGHSVQDGNGTYSIENGNVVLTYWDDVQPPIDGNKWKFTGDEDFLRVERKYTSV